MSILEHKKYNRDQAEQVGSKFLISNGYMGYRGTLDEADSSDYVALNINGLYDGDRFVESVNVFNPLYTMVKADGIDLNPRSFRPKRHRIALDTSNGVFKRSTKFQYRDAEITLKSERFMDQTQKTNMYLKYTFTTNTAVSIEFFTGIDSHIWNIQGNHLDEVDHIKEDGKTISVCKTKYDGIDVVIGVLEDKSFDAKEELGHQGIRKYTFTMKPKETYTVYKYVSVVHSEEDALNRCETYMYEAKQKGFKALYDQNTAFWKEVYKLSEVAIYNNDEAKEIVDYAVYQLIAHRPYSEHVSINHKGLSGQYDYSAVHWSTEIMCLPFYINTMPDTARIMIKYRMNGLKKAMEKATLLGYEGAFYAEKAGTLGKELSDRELHNNIHVNGSIMYGVYQYIERTKDYQILFEGAMEMLLECSRFYLAYATLAENKKHYDYLSINGLDDIHETVDNEAYTNMMIKNALDSMIKCVAFAKGVDKFKVKDMFAPMNYEQLIKDVRELRRKLYMKNPNIDYLLEGFDQYFNLEDKDISTLKRISFKEETEIEDLPSTSYMNQANVIPLLSLFIEEYSNKVMRTNYDYYLRRTIKPDVFTRVMYIILACASDRNDEAYKQLTTLAHLDPANDYLFKQGLDLTLCGGIYLTMVYGFAGVRHHVYLLEGEYNNTNNIRRLEFKVKVVNHVADVKIKRNSVTISWES